MKTKTLQIIPLNSQPLFLSEDVPDAQIQNILPEINGKDRG